MKAFFDTNILIYTVSQDHRKQKASDILQSGGAISAQVLNEFTHTTRKKLGCGWSTIELALSGFRQIFDDIRPLTAETHAAAFALARAHAFSFYDALIISSALEAGCDTLFTEDMQNGRKIKTLTIRNPFLDGTE